MTDRPRTRLFIESDLASGMAVECSRDQAHYLGNVLRLGPGDPVALFNGRDGEWLAHIRETGKKSATLTVDSCLRDQAPEPDLWLVFAPVKKAPLDFLVQKATELGVSALMPAITRRTVVERVKRERMEANAIEAAEQCERLTVPHVEDARPLSRILDGWPTDRHILLCAEAGEAVPINEFLRGAEGRGEPWAILTGPEGGFDQTELDLLNKFPNVSAVGLGPRILRADTAALAALACWQAALGDWQNRPPGRN
ncbi:MAG: 16S rRNA (uracil(1498)-N(3))-methyltransferase [Alphaproteobacteria bacterium]|nr:16S rRNA (uracil(1498)-N(3))-methyltransferase [Alphaproteobacteria bacterium]